MSIVKGTARQLRTCFFIAVTLVTFQLSAQVPSSNLEVEPEWKALLVEYFPDKGKEFVTDLEAKLRLADDHVRKHVIKAMRTKLRQHDTNVTLQNQLNKLTPEDWASLNDEDLRELVGAIPFLTRLDLRGTSVTDDGIASLADSSIVELGLAGTSVSDEGVRRFVTGIQQSRPFVSKHELELAGLGMFEGTRIHLDLSNTRVGDKSVAALVQLKDLTAISLSGTQVTNKGTALLATVAGLEALDLSVSDVGDEGVVALTQLEHLRVLKLGWTKVTDYSLPFLAKLTDLVVLELTGTELTEKELHRLTALSNLDKLTLPRFEGITAQHTRERLWPRLFPWRASGHRSLFLPWSRWRGLATDDVDRSYRYQASLTSGAELAIVTSVPVSLKDRRPMRIIDLLSGDSHNLTFENKKELASSCPIALSNDAKLLATGANRVIGKTTVYQSVVPNHRFSFTKSQRQPELVTIWKMPNRLSEQAALLSSVEVPWTVATMAFSPGAAHLLVTSATNTDPASLIVGVLEIRTGELKTIEITTNENAPVNSLLSKRAMALSPNGRLVAMSNRHGLGILDLQSSEVHYLFREELHADGPVYSMRGQHHHHFSQDGRWLISSVEVRGVPDWDRNRVLIFDMRSHQLTAQIIGSLEAISGDGSILLARDSARSALWHLDDGVPRQLGHTHHLANPVLSKDGSWMFSATSSTGKRQFGVWDLQNLQEL